MKHLYYLFDDSKVLDDEMGRIRARRGGKGGRLPFSGYDSAIAVRDCSWVYLHWAYTDSSYSQFVLDGGAVFAELLAADRLA